MQRVTACARYFLLRHSQTAMRGIARRLAISPRPPGPTLSLVRPYSTPTTSSTISLPLEGGERRFNRQWLRENCQCSECYHPETYQRNVLFYALSPASLEVVSCQRDEGAAVVRWADGHESRYDSGWLAAHSHPGRTGVGELQRLWDGVQMSASSPRAVPQTDFMASDSAVGEFLSHLLRDGVSMVSGVEPSVDATQAVCERVCFVQETLFGRMWSFTADMSRADTSYTNMAIGGHTDNTYLQLPAGIQVFHCTHHDGEGGETLLVDGFHAAEQLRTQDQEAFDLLKSRRIHHEYREQGYHMRSLDSIITTNPVNDQLEKLRYNHYDRAPIDTMHQDEVGDFYKALTGLSERLTDPANEFWIKLSPGSVLFVDNWRVLHGRGGFTGQRQMCGCYISRDDWLSRARTLGVL